jgi:hypothetical protein
MMALATHRVNLDKDGKLKRDYCERHARRLEGVAGFGWSLVPEPSVECPACETMDVYQ